MLKNSKTEPSFGRGTLNKSSKVSPFGQKCRENGFNLSQFSLLQRISEHNFQMTQGGSNKLMVHSRK